MLAFSRFLDRVSTWVGVLAGWLIVPMIVAMCYEVAARYVFGAPTIWAYELAYLLTGAGWLLGMAYALAKNAHIRIDVVSARLSPRTVAVIDVLAYILLVLPFLVWVATVLDDRMLIAMRSGERTGQSAWNPPIWPFRAVFFVAFLLLALQVLAEIVRKICLLVGRAEQTRA